jgi:choline-sulfatase
MIGRPNVLLVMTDEHNRDIAGFSGDRIVDTHNLDRLASRAVQFQNASCVSPICTPSRMCMLTGLDAHNCSAWSNHWVLFPEHVTWPAHFAAHGYRTGLVGKMHFGGRDQMNGFQGRPYGDLRHALGHQPDPLSMYPGYGQAESAGVSEIPESLMQDVIVTRETLSLIFEHTDTEPETPWFVCASYGRPHAPLTAPGRYIRRYRDKVPPPEKGRSSANELDAFAKRLVSDVSDEQAVKAREAYYASVDFVDDCIGDMLNGLETKGLLDNTIVIYTADHGDMLGLYGCWGKQLYHEYSAAVPLLVAGPETARGVATDRVVSLIDLFPTVCEMAGLPTPENLDGVDISGLLSRSASGSANGSHSNVAPREFAPSAAYRYGVRIHYNRTDDDLPNAAWRSVRDERWKYVEVERGARLLFDLENDRWEAVNLAGDPDNTVRCERMREWLYRGFSWEMVHQRLTRDRERIVDFYSGLPPGTPNQYMLSDGRVFDAEKSLYESRWLPIVPGSNGGIIPQQFG